MHHSYAELSKDISYSVLKYAMTLDGKIAASTEHASWVLSKESLQRVFVTGGRNDAINVGGNTIRRDYPRLTRQGGHLPFRSHVKDIESTRRIASLGCCRCTNYSNDPKGGSF